MLVSEDTQPEGTEEHHGDGQDPTGVKTLTEERGFPVEVPSPRKQDGEWDGKDHGLFIVQSLE